jgi:hypothetical protein
MKKTVISVLACAVAFLGFGCSSDHSVNVGDGVPVAVDKSKLESYEGQWDGYVEAYTFPSGTDRVRVTLDKNGNGQLQVGDGSVAPPPTNPDVGYPDALNRDVVKILTGQIPSTSSSVMQYLWDGIAYPVAGARIESERVRFTLDPASAPVFGQWCVRQTTTYCYDGPSSQVCHCVSPSAMNYPDGACGYPSPDDPATRIPVDCGKMELCNDVCACTPTGCTKSDQILTYSFQFDAALSDDGKELVGTFVLPDYNGGARTIRLKR